MHVQRDAAAQGGDERRVPPRFRRVRVINQNLKLPAGGDHAPDQPRAIATQVVVRVTPSMLPMSSVTSVPIASRLGPVTTAMKS